MQQLLKHLKIREPALIYRGLKSKGGKDSFRCHQDPSDGTSKECFKKDSLVKGFLWWHNGKESACNAGAAGDVGLIPGLEKSPSGGNGNPHQYSCLEHPMDRGTWQATVHGVAKSRTQLRDCTRVHTKPPKVGFKI